MTTETNQAALTIVEVPFRGDILHAVQQFGDVWVSIRRVCEVLGLSLWSQLRKLAGEPWATVVEMTMVAEDGKNREVSCISLDALPMWLAGIKSGKVAAEIRPKLVAYQKECAKVLRDHFLPKAVPTPAKETYEAKMGDIPPNAPFEVVLVYRHLEDLLKHGMITMPQALKARSRLIEHVLGDIGVFENIDRVSTKPASLPSENTVTVTVPPGGAVVAKAVVDQSNTFSARSIGKDIGMSSVAVGQFARGLDIHGKSDFGIFVDLDSNGGKINEHFRYNEKARQMIIAAYGHYEKLPKKTQAESIEAAITKYIHHPLENKAAQNS